jgi:hypothetical protein
VSSGGVGCDEHVRGVIGRKREDLVIEEDGWEEEGREGGAEVRGDKFGVGRGIDTGRKT